MVIAPSFADIFYNNCFKNGLLAITLPAAVVDTLFDQVANELGYRLDIDLEGKCVNGANGESYAFEIDDFRQHCLLNGLDDIGLTLESSDAIAAFEGNHLKQYPWVALK